MSKDSVYWTLTLYGNINFIIRPFQADCLFIGPTDLKLEFQKHKFEWQVYYTCSSYAWLQSLWGNYSKLPNCDWVWQLWWLLFVTKSSCRNKTKSSRCLSWMRVVKKEQVSFYLLETDTWYYIMMHDTLYYCTQPPGCLVPSSFGTHTHTHIQGLHL